MLTHERNMTWLEALPFCVTLMNSHRNKSTGQVPHTLISGRRPRLNLPESLHDPDIRAETPDSYGKIIRKRIQMLSKLATVANESADLELEKRAKRHAPARQLKKGDMVHLYRPCHKSRQRLWM